MDSSNKGEEDWSMVGRLPQVLGKRAFGIKKGPVTMIVGRDCSAWEICAEYG